MPRVGFFHAPGATVRPGQLMVGPEMNGEGTAIRVTVDGEPAGWYVDDEQPEQAAVIESLRGQGLLLAGVPIGDPDREFPGALSLLEFYPVGYPTWPDLPPARGYILQGTFRWPGGPSADRAQRRRMWREAVAHRPEVVLWYRWGPRLAPQVQGIMRAPL